MLDRVLAFGDGWFPNRVSDPDALTRRIDELARRAEEAGRRRIPVTAYGARPEPDIIERHAEGGVDRCVFWLPPAAPDDVERELDRLTGVVERCSAVAR